MKILSLLVLLTSFSSIAATVNSARLDDAKQNILISVSYGGGCAEHTFTLEIDSCLEKNPVDCTAFLVEKVEGGFDGCEALIHKTVVINLKQSGLDKRYFKKGRITILGEEDYMGRTSSATVVLP